MIFLFTRTVFILSPFDSHQTSGPPTGLILSRFYHGRRPSGPSMAHPYPLLHDHIFCLTARPKGAAPPRHRRAHREEVALRTTSKDGATGGSRDHAFNFGTIACLFSLLTCYPAHLGCTTIVLSRCCCRAPRHAHARPPSS
jgi:hypothetical protein